MQILILLTFLGVASSSRILFLYPTPSKSHMIVAHSLSTTLAERGHDVTILTAFPLDNKIQNHREIIVPFDDKDLKDFTKQLVENPNTFILKTLPKALDMTFDLARVAVEVPEFKKIVREEKFDLVIVGMFFNNFLLGYGEVFNCPTAMLSVLGSLTSTNLLTGNPLSVNAVPSLFISDLKEMNFFDRVKNFLIHGLELMVVELMNYKMKNVYDDIFPSNHRSYDESLKNLSLVMVNGHFSQGHPRPNVPALVEVGGIQVKPKPNPLPETLKSFLDGASNGVILFSLGSNVKTSFLSREKVEILLKVFGKLKQRVIMKWESDVLEGKPQNVMVSKWLPQDDVLAHSNVKLFISHCGLGGTVEAKYHAVPIVALPVFADQETNANIIVGEGWALKLSLKDLNEEDLMKAINEIIGNSKYSEAIKELSQLYHDRPMNARETASYWVEYVIRHRGAPHMQYPAIHQNFIQRNSLDVIGFLLLFIYFAFKFFSLIIRKVCWKLCCGSGKISKNKKKNKKL